MPAIYVMTDQGKRLVEMSELPYELEDVLQALLQDYPDLLAGDSSSEVRRRYLLIGREVGLPAEAAGAERWSVDHLFVDQDAVPTIVEVKRSTDTRIRREVVGQMLDYAANAVVYWPVERLKARLESRVGDSQPLLSELMGGDIDPEEFWNRVDTNLRAGRIRLIFVADTVPVELQRIVEFLNGQFRSAEVLALEVKRYAGEDVQALVAERIGDTAVADASKAGGPKRAKRQWDEASFFDDLSKRVSPEATHVARKLLHWAQQNQLRVWWGEGAIDGSFMPMLDAADKMFWTFAIYTNGSLEFQFMHMAKWGPFADDGRRLELLRRFNELDGIQMPEERATKRPSVPLAVIAPQLDRFISLWDSYLQETRSFAERT